MINSNLTFLGNCNWDSILLGATMAKPEKFVIWITASQNGEIKSLSKDLLEHDEKTGCANVQVTQKLDGSKPTLHLANISSLTEEAKAEIESVFSQFNEGKG